MKASYCIIIPCFKHGSALGAVLDRLSACQLPIIVVDDGNEADEAELIEKTCAAREQVTLLKNPQNSGKGAAFFTGIKLAHKLHYTHAVQIDADGQHALEDLPRLLELSYREPTHLISACPIYDKSVPKARQIGRYATHIWVWIETLSLEIKDSMCGYRVYPVDSTLKAFTNHTIGLWMDFDTSIMVYLFWEGVKVDFLPSKVTYPQDGVSNFKAFKDNLRISLMHTKLCIYMLCHLPQILHKRFKSSKHWAEQSELKGLWGMRLMLFLVRIGGRNLFSLLLYPIIAVYYLVAGRARLASRIYRQQLELYAKEQGISLPDKLSGFRHFYSFAQSMLDKILAWQNQLRFNREVFYAPHADEILNRPYSSGRLIIGSHLGTIETLRALSHFNQHRIVNALVFTEHAERFKQIMDEFAPKSNVNLMAVKDLNLSTVEQLQRKISQGEDIAILGDRIPVQSGRGGYRVGWVPFLGKMAPLPQGPFVLASVLKCPVLLLHALREGRSIRIYCELFTEQVKLDSAHKQQSLEHYQRAYAKALERLTLTHPLEWFNFYDFWTLPESHTPREHHAQN